MNISRSMRKGLVELLLVVVIAVTSFLLAEPEIGIGAGGLWALEQVRRLARDAQKGAPIEVGRTPPIG